MLISEHHAQRMLEQLAKSEAGIGQRSTDVALQNKQ